MNRRKRKQLRKRARGHSRHHRHPKSRGGNEHRGIVSNISKVSRKQHRAWHTLFKNMTAHEIAAYINEIWLDPLYKVRLERVDE